MKMSGAAGRQRKEKRGQGQKKKKKARPPSFCCSGARSLNLPRTRTFPPTPHPHHTMTAGRSPAKAGAPPSATKGQRTLASFFAPGAPAAPKKEGATDAGALKEANNAGVSLCVSACVCRRVAWAYSHCIVERGEQG